MKSNDQLMKEWFERVHIPIGFKFYKIPDLRKKLEHVDFLFKKGIIQDYQLVGAKVRILRKFYENL